MKTEPSWNAISFLNIRIKPTEMLINQKQIMTAQTRLNVTTCLYLSPNDRARSLSTLIAVDVKADTPHKIMLKAPQTSWT